MQAVSDLFLSIQQSRHRKEIKVVVGGTEFGMDSIVSLTTVSNLYAEDQPMIGSCVSAEIDLTFLPGNYTPPRMAELDVFVRVANDEEVSEWIPKGVFFTDTRTVDTTTGEYTLHGYDAMLKAEQPFIGEVVEDDWPQTPTQVVDEIARRIGVTVDPRTVLDDNFPVGLDFEYSCREVLGHIAAANAGNWIITDDGALRLVPLAEQAAATSLLVDEHGNYLTFGGVRILV